MNIQNIFEVETLAGLKDIMESCVTVISAFTVESTPLNMKRFIRQFLKRKSESFPLLTFVYMKVSEEDRDTLNILKGDDEDFPKVYHFRNGRTILVEVKSASESDIVDSFKAVEKYYIEEMRVFQKEMSKRGTKKQTNEDESDEQIEIGDENQEEDDGERLNGATDEDDEEQPKRKHIDPKTVKGKKNVKEQEQQENTNKNMSLPDMKIPVEPAEIDPALEKKKNLEKLVLLNKKSDDVKLEMVKDITKRKKMEIALDNKKKKEEKGDDGKEYRKNIKK
jgi:hypothetical protein